jgi:tRNA nucleotidyltransferase (CCA-adding enzyme)
LAVKTYLVGGAVRDALLGLPVHERDWVVTGAVPDDLLGQAYRQVGASFPVFLHPETGEEYALARTERKSGRGYHGFEVQFSPDVTIEQDLLRRDLTINAMAQDADGKLIDPHGGRADLEARVLRHISDAFVEDPLRVLRVARFAARFHELGFSVHADTRALMADMAESGELQHLVPERAWQEIEGGMATANPSVFVQVLRDCGALARLLPEVDALFGVPQDPEWHPEVDTGAHLLLALDRVPGLGGSAGAAVAVLLHDLGKALTDPALWPRHHGHESTGLPLVSGVCERFRMPNRVRRLAEQVCGEHLRCHRLLEARPATVMKLLERLDAFRNPDLDDFLCACQADWQGRTGLEARAYPQADRLRAALQAARSVRAADLPGDIPPGPAVGEALRAARIEAIGQVAVEAREHS